jgi:phosphatidylserine decarboxylase
MAWEILISSLCLSLIILLPLSKKFGIPIKISLLYSLFIGLLAGLIVSGVEGIYYIKYFHSLILLIFLISGIFGAFLVWRFYRNPDRIPPEDTKTILSPADGKVIYVKRYENGCIPYAEKKGKKILLNDLTQSDVFSTEGHLIGISMNFLDVHINRAPIDGTVTVIRHIKGSFLSLKKEDALVLNERALTVIENGHFKVGVVQIASRLVRKIDVYFGEGQKIRRGERLGMIRFGSQVDLILTCLPNIKIEVKPGDSVKAGVSVVARIVREQ